MASWPGYSAGLTLDVLDTWGPLVSFVFTLYFSSIVQRFGSVYDLVMHLGAASLIAGIIFVILVMRRPNGAPLILMRHFAALRACLAYGVIAWLFVETTSGPNEHHRVPLIKVLWFLLLMYRSVFYAAVYRRLDEFVAERGRAGARDPEASRHSISDPYTKALVARLTLPCLIVGQAMLMTIVCMLGIVCTLVDLFETWHGTYLCVKHLCGTLLAGGIVLIVCTHIYIDGRHGVFKALTVKFEVAKSCMATGLWIWLLLELSFGPASHTIPFERDVRPLAYLAARLLILFYPAAFYAAVYQKDELKGAAELGMEASAVHGGQTTHGGVPNETPT